MESWDEWEAEIHERLAELTNEQPSLKNEQDRRWLTAVSAAAWTEGLTRFRAFLGRVKRVWEMKSETTTR